MTNQEAPRGCFGHCPDCGQEEVPSEATEGGCICSRFEEDDNPLKGECPCMGSREDCPLCDPWDAIGPTPGWEIAGQSPHFDNDIDGFWVRPKAKDGASDDDMPF